MRTLNDFMKLINEAEKDGVDSNRIICNLAEHDQVSVVSVKQSEKIVSTYITFMILKSDGFDMYSGTIRVSRLNNTKYAIAPLLKYLPSTDIQNMKSEIKEYKGNTEIFSEVVSKFCDTFYSIYRLNWSVRWVKNKRVWTKVVKGAWFYRARIRTRQIIWELLDRFWIVYDSSLRRKSILE